ncbi:hypothetical protein SAMN05216352_106195 [Alteribacillus bidgolensis]|uniref:Uncharacterized protein n=1 Tax=Alteribacillus bidgolensis TaxID=930129 RepID=A0A1G8JGS1_9BACI|nr:hypothetical protein SAMN05216352_106195 [Alteribacillus bidgolensis]
MNNSNETIGVKDFDVLVRAIHDKSSELVDVTF